jgi:nicotinamidase-related amidase
MSAHTIERAAAAILLIDAQPLFWEAMHGPQEPVLARIEQLLRLAGLLALPLIATFEHPLEEKGSLPARLERVFPAHGERFVKRTFDCCADGDIREALQSLQAAQFVVAGAETDVCVLQSVLGLLRMGVQVFLLEDCLFTSEPHPGPALERMVRAGAIPCTYKTLFYELTRSVGFLPSQVKAGAISPTALESLIAPEELPPWHPQR